LSEVSKNTNIKSSVFIPRIKMIYTVNVNQSYTDVPLKFTIMPHHSTFVTAF
jgi:hypothetical protein